MKIAIIHDWLNGYRGGERCLQLLLDLLPGADIFTLIYEPGTLTPEIEARKIWVSPFRLLPFAKTKYRNYLPLMPFFIERFNLKGYDFIFSSSHCVAKSVPHAENVPHVCYCHSPMRYAWTQFHQYFSPEKNGQLKYAIIKQMMQSLRKWDYNTAKRVTQYVGNSDNIANRIKDCYDIEADVIHPPVECRRFTPASKKEDTYLVLSAFAPYKRVDLAVEACTRMNKKLRVIGSGQDEARLKKMAGPTVEFLGWTPDEEVAQILAKAKALLFPGEEDFGIVPLEAQASGTPVIAYGKGGALETIISPDNAQGKKPTGLFFKEQSLDSLCEAIEAFEKEEQTFEESALLANAKSFNVPVFLKKWRELFKGYGIGV